ncbi:NAD(P)/FAD-dependent oxidoreductase [Priestia filamentosa]|uniref:NAD(P)/FAD-dependent oxidoreductase n=1 Tax=Priestia filamentosa TaxID=1402861 RepID=UPI003D2B9ECA
MMVYDCIIVGGGIAGLQAAIQLGRYRYKILVLDTSEGRSTLCKGYHNLLGWPQGVSGETLRKLGRKQALSYGVAFEEEKAVSVVKKQIFEVHTEQNTFGGKTLLLATGLRDHFPLISSLKACLGKSIYVCPDCDGYEIIGKKTAVLGAGKVGASLSLELAYFDQPITYINHGEELDLEMQKTLHEHNISILSGSVASIEEENGIIKSALLKSGEKIEMERAFLAFGGNKIHNELALMLGVEHEKKGHVIVDPRTKETNIENVWAIGDLVAHSQQVAIALGDGVQAAIWIHKRLKKPNI